MNIQIIGRTATNGGTIYSSREGNTALVSIGYKVDDKTEWQVCRGYGIFADAINKLSKGDKITISGEIVIEQRQNRSTLNNYDIKVLIVKSIEKQSISKGLVLKTK